MKKRIFKICGVANAKLKTPYKLCEYKLLYGKLFEKYIRKYEFWGYCDLDLVFGKIGDFVTDELLDAYDKFYSRGHLTIYRNNEFFKNLYMVDDSRMRVNYRIAWGTNHCVHFDELPCWNEIVSENGYRCYDHVDFCDIEISRFRFSLAMGDNYPTSKQIFEYNNGDLFRHYLNNNGDILKEKIMYIHLQKRKMDCLTSYRNNYLIIPNSFINPKAIDYNFLDLNSKEKIFWITNKKDRIKEILKNIKNGAIKIRVVVLCRKYKMRFRH